MKVAVPTRDERVDDHFGHCDHYTIFTIEDNKVINRETMASPQGCGCKSGVAADLQELGVVMMLAGNMGEGAKNKLNSHNIDVMTLLDGKRNSKKPIHKEAYCKELTKEKLITVIEYFEEVLSSFMTEEQ